MSELKIDKVSPRTGTYVSLNTVGFKNIIINGDMSIAQRGTSTASVTTSNYNTVDRFKLSPNSMGTWTVSQDTDVPSGQGFAKSFKIDCTTADAAPAAGDYVIFQQFVEGQNLQYLKKGTANAESLTASFWVKSNKTGTYILNLYDQDNTRNISKSYTINSASTWEKKTVTFDGDTTGAFDNDNALSLQLNFWLGGGTNFTSGTLATSWESYTAANQAVGQVNLADNTANNFWITGVQLEAGTTASDFEFLPVDVNLARCHRYYFLFVNGTGIGIVTASSYTASTAYGVFIFPTEMRAVPSLDQVVSASYYTYLSDGNSRTFDQLAISAATNKLGRLSTGSSIATTSGDSGWFQSNNAGAYVAFDAEL